jgi:hypothetical protein
MSAAANVVPLVTGDLTAQEQAHVRVALRFLRARWGTWATLARALKFKDTTLANVSGGHKAVSASVAVRVARFAEVGVDDILGGKFPPRCTHCGQVQAEEPGGQRP